MWIVYALISGFFAGITSLLSKVSVDNSDTNLITFLRTIIIFITSIIIVLFFKSYSYYYNLNIKNVIILILSGITTALMWLYYFKSMANGNINKITPVEKSSIVLTMVFSFIFFNEEINFLKVISISLILLGVFLMIKKNDETVDNKKWLLYSILTAIFNSLTTILTKYGLSNVDTKFSTMLRTFVVLIIIFVIVFIKKKLKDIKLINNKNIFLIILSGISTTISWLFYFSALNKGSAGVVFSLEKSSIIVVYVLSILFLKEKTSLKQFLGLLSIIFGMCIIML